MTDNTPASGGSAPDSPTPPFSSLRQARLDRGLTLEGMASMIKVTPAKLEALESGRYQDLPDAAFTRALAMAVCRVLRIDPAPVLAGLPAAHPISLAASAAKPVPFDASRASLKLNLDMAHPGIRWSAILAPRFLVPLGVLLAAALLYVFPSDVDWSALWPKHEAAPVSAEQGGHAEAVALGASQIVAEEVVPSVAIVASGASAAEAVASQSLGTPLVATVDPAASTPIAAAEAASMPVLTVERRQPGSMRSGSALVMVSFADSWVEVRNGKGERLLSRTVASGETVGIDGDPPLYVKIGNASGIQVSYLGHAIGLDPYTRNNVARLELKSTP